MSESEAKESAGYESMTYGTASGQVAWERYRRQEPEGTVETERLGVHIVAYTRHGGSSEGEVDWAVRLDRFADSRPCIRSRYSDYAFILHIRSGWCRDARQRCR